MREDKNSMISKFMSKQNIKSHVMIENLNASPEQLKEKFTNKKLGLSQNNRRIYAMSPKFN